MSRPFYRRSRGAAGARRPSAATGWRYAWPVETNDPSEVASHLAQLRQQHRALDERIAALAANAADELEAKRLKKRKLQLKDCILRLESLLIPDEPA